DAQADRQTNADAEPRIVEDLAGEQSAERPEAEHHPQEIPRIEESRPQLHSWPLLRTPEPECHCDSKERRRAKQSSAADEVSKNIVGFDHIQLIFRAKPTSKFIGKLLRRLSDDGAFQADLDACRQKVP